MEIMTTKGLGVKKFKFLFMLPPVFDPFDQDWLLKIMLNVVTVKNYIYIRVAIFQIQK